MSLRDLKGLLKPGSIVVTGDGAVAAIVRANLVAGGFKGTIAAVTGDTPLPAGITGRAAIEDLAAPPDLAVLCGPTDQALDTLRGLAAKGVHSALVLGGTGRAEAPALAAAEIGLAARQAGMRLIGPDCFGVQIPKLGLNAAIGAGPLAPPGKIALVTQSTTLGAAAVNWARTHGIGLSAVIGLGRALDVDFGDALDWLAADGDTRAILMIVESMRERRDFIAAARSAARIKPVLAMKIGEREPGGDDSGTHAGSLATTEAVYDAVLRRAGILRVLDMRELFMAAETLVRGTPIRDGALTVLANGRGVAGLVVDELRRRGGALATLSAETRAALTALGAADPSDGPIDIGIDAPAASYRHALDTLFNAPECDTVLVVHAATALVDPDAAAQALVEATRGRRPSVIACWSGLDAGDSARQRLQAAGVPAYDTTADAVRAFMHMADHRRNQSMLMETPPSVPEIDRLDTITVRVLVRRALKDLRFVLPEPEAKKILAAYGIRSVPAKVARDAAQAARIARRLGGPVAVKILSPDISHKSDYGGVVLDLPGPFEVEKACHAMRERIVRALPGAKIEGFTVQPMARRPGAVEILMGVATDPVFGPVILFGQGGVAVEAIGDVVLGLPPLNMTLARALVHRSRVLRLLRGYRGHAPADLDAVCDALVRVSQLVVDVPEIAGMDINPLFADAEGVLALDARMTLAPSDRSANRLAIRPYPKELEEVVTLGDGKRVLLRPIRPEDEPNHHALIANTAKQDLRFRFFTAIGEIAHAQMARLTQIDYVREMAFIAVPAEEPGRETLGVVRIVADADNDTAEYAILVRSDTQGAGIGHALMEKIIRYCRARNIRRITGEVLTENRPMLKLAEAVGFKRARYVDGDIVEVELDLAPPT
jgi:acetyltransferase